MEENIVAKIVELCRVKDIPVSRLEKDLGFGNGSINPEKSTDLKSQRLNKILNYLGISYEEFYGTSKEEKEKPATGRDESNESSNNELNDYANSLFKQLPIEKKIYLISQMQAQLQNTPTLDVQKESD